MHGEQRRWRLAVMVLAGALVMVGGAVAVSAKGAPVRAQEQRPNQVPSIGAPEPSDAMPGNMKDQQAKAAVDERRKRVVADTDRLLVLATELKQEVDKSTKDELSVKAIKRAEDIEKLAHQVKERMKGN